MHWFLMLINPKTGHSQVASRTGNQRRKYTFTIHRTKKLPSAFGYFCKKIHSEKAST